MHRQIPKVPLGFIIWLVMITVWVTWAPFELRVEEKPRLQLHPTADLETASHLLLLMPIALVCAALVYDRNARCAFAQAWGIVMLFGLLLEIGQWWVKGRSLSPYDVLANGIGAAFAIWVTAQLLHRGMGVRLMLVFVGVLMFTGVLMSTAYSVILHSEGLRVTGWDPSFAVHAGEEWGGKRPYQGHVWDAQICTGEPPRKICVAPGADTEARHELMEMAERSQRIELSAQVLSSTDEQTGPARIVTFSHNTSLRNVTLGQFGRHLSLRVRTPRSGPNATNFAFMLPEAVYAGRPTYVMATFARGVVNMQAKSEAAIVSGSFRPDLLRTSIQARGSEIVYAPMVLRGRTAFVGAIVAFITLGLTVGWLLRTRCLVALLVGVAVVTLSLWAVDVWVLKTLPPGTFELALAAGAAVLGVLLAAWDWHRVAAST